MIFANKIFLIYTLEDLEPHLAPLNYFRKTT